MRERIGMPLGELVRAVASDLWIDIELMANPSRKHPMIHINEFVSVVNNFLVGNNLPTISNLLEYLEYAAERSRLEAPRSKPQNKVIQVLTIHGAKGLEWDYVAVPNLVEEDFPSTTGGFMGWLSVGKLPYPLRGDRRTLPEFDVLAYEDQKQVEDAKKAFKEHGVKPMLLAEERRLIYVAVTRPKHDLLLTGSYWKPGTKKAKRPSIFVDECLVSGVELIADVQDQDSDAQVITPLQSDWPRLPFESSRLVKVEQARDAVDAADANDSVILDSEISKQIKQLLEERDAKNELTQTVDFTVRISASNFKAYLGELDEVAGNALRPLPSQPFAASRTGNLFHNWVEKSFAPSGELFDDEFDELEDIDDFVAIEVLQKNFENSRFSKLTPVAIEQEIQLTIDSNTFVCKMDAIYATEDGVQIVDWKTNKPPTDKEDLYRRSLQLALYRLAYSEFTGMPIEKVQASFFFVGDNEELTPDVLLGRAEILAEWNKVLAKLVD
jgi:DNA helicase-2/ATP-dependent DNA helicase PcrA